MIAKISKKINLRVFIIGIALFLLILEVYFYRIPVLSGAAVALYIALVGKSIGERLTADKEIQWWGGIAALLSLVSLTNVIFYYIYKITPEISLFSIILPLSLLGIQKKEGSTIISHTEHSEVRLPIYVFFILESVLMGLIIHARNGELMPSPWLAFSPPFFILFAMTSALLFYLLTNKTSSKVMLMGAVVHFFIFYCIAAIVYRLGFGFDGFIHRATESWILGNGFINPKEPFYIGQYGLVVTLSRITGITIKYIDIFLVPLLASISLPSLLYITLPKIWNITKHYSIALSFVIPCAFFLSFNLTTPHNLVVLLLVIISIGLVAYHHSILPYSVIAVLSLWALATHPLLGGPILCIVLASFILKKYQTKKITPVLCGMVALLLIVIPMTMFSLQQWLAGYGLPSLTNPISNAGLLKEYFVRPFWYKTDAVWYLEILYIWQYAITPTIILLSLIGIWYARKLKLTWLLLSSSLGLCIGAFVLRTLITFPNVSSHEQGNYPLRLLIGSVALLLPLCIYGIYMLVEKKLTLLQKKIKLRNTTLYTLGAIKIALILMLSLYFAYPQYNSKVYFPGFNVTEYDKKVVNRIHNENTNNNYVVLSTILTAVTSLTEYPFAHYIDTKEGSQFYYSIPAGGPLYTLYEEMLYQGQKLQTIQKVFELTNVNKVYFVVPWYWKNSDQIVAGAKKNADSWHSINEKMWIFEYLRPDN